MTYASYEKQIECRCIRERHIVRIRLNETKNSLLQSLSDVPDCATVSMIIGDDAHSNEHPAHGEIYFDYERASE